VERAHQGRLFHGLHQQREGSRLRGADGGAGREAANGVRLGKQGEGKCGHDPDYLKIRSIHEKPALLPGRVSDRSAFRPIDYMPSSLPE
jgi:hypothetical protein